MKNAQLKTKGFTLIASLLLLLLLSGIAIGLMMMVNTESKVGGTDLQSNAAYHAAEGGIEKMTSDLAATFQNAQSPTASQICAVSSQQPTLAGVTWTQYQVTPGQVGMSCPSSLTSSFGQISGGPNQGLWAQIIPINLLATAMEPGGQEVTMTRNAQVALIPVFQFGVFSDSDLSFFSGPNFDFGGRVHTNSDLYPEVGNGSTLTFYDKISVYGNVVRANLANKFSTSSNYNGTVLIPTQKGGCTGSGASATCKALGLSDGSVTGTGGNPPQSSQNYPYWQAVSETTFNYEIIDGDYGAATCGGGSAICGTGAKKLALPFVNGTTFPYEIIRRPPAGESQTSALSQSREYNMAQIRVLLSDDPAELPGGASSADNVRLANVTGTGGSNGYGIPISPTPTGTNPVYIPTALPALTGSNTYNLYFAAASNALPDVTSCAGTNCGPAGATSLTAIPNDWPFGPATPASGAQTLVPTGAPIISGTGGSGAAPPTINLCPPATTVGLPAGCPAYPYYASAPTTTWNLIDGYLRVEYRDSTGTWKPVTMEWLKLGFARGLTPPSAGVANPINPSAILLLQQPADRRARGTFVANDYSGLAPACLHSTSGKCDKWTNPLPPEVLTDASMPAAPSTSISPWFGVTNTGTAAQSLSMYNWYPINFYDAREGEVRDNATGDNTCTANGAMNAVEIDVGNLKKWLNGTIAGSGNKVDNTVQNGYVLYFSDRRGMLPNPNAANAKTGDSGLEDDVNAPAAAGTPDGLLEGKAAGYPASPEDVNQNGLLDNFGAANLGLAFFGTAGVATNSVNAQIIAAAPDNPYMRIDDGSGNACSTVVRKNWVSGARHVLKLVDGALGNVPMNPDNTTGGFTVASENPVYVQGDYNSNAGDPIWGTTPKDATTGHSATAIIADAVSLLSSAWNDLNSFNGPTSKAARNANDTYYRLAIAGGKNMNFPQPTTWAAGQDFGTDGGTHNFLRYLEDWSGNTLTYKGSLVSMYYATYNTGIYKCCTIVYSPPTRKYSFDADFTTPSGLPPGTPMFRDVNTLGYRQTLTARKAGE